MWKLKWSKTTENIVFYAASAILHLDTQSEEVHPPSCFPLSHPSYNINKPNNTTCILLQSMQPMFS